MKLRRCAGCGRYTMEKVCCGKKTKCAHPRKWTKKEMVECLKVL